MAVHALTASGAVLGFLALASVLNGDIDAAFLWLGAALAVDGVDGPLARKVGVREATPELDGATLDNVIDYFTYVAVPAVMVWSGGFVPSGWETPAAAAMMGASTYTFANASMKTEDWWFRGFPAVWNLVVFAFYVLGTGPWWNLGVIAVCLALTFAPLKFVHPFRVRAFRPATLAATAAWAGASGLLLALPEAALAGAARAVWAVCAAWFGALTLWRSFGPGRPDRA